MISNKLKDIIYKKLYSELSHLEIIRYKEEIWFIDRDNKYWYFIYNDNGTMWWKYGFFCTFFEFFSITDEDEFGPILSSWVEEVLNCKVNTTFRKHRSHAVEVEEVLNCKVNTTEYTYHLHWKKVEEVLNCKVNTTNRVRTPRTHVVEEVLNCKVNTTHYGRLYRDLSVAEVLDYKVEMAIKWMGHPPINVNEVLRGNDITQ